MERSSHNRVVLVADEDKKTRDLIDKHVRPFGYHVIFAETGREVSELLQRRKWEFLFLGAIFPDMKADKIIKGVKNKTILPPFIVLIRREDEKLAGQMIKAGALDCWILDKTFHTTIERRIKRVMDEVRTLRRLDEMIRKAASFEKQIQVLFNTMSDPIVIVNKKKRIVYKNHSFREIFGSFDSQEPCYSVIYGRHEPCPWCNGNEKIFKHVPRLIKRSGYYYQPVTGQIRLNKNRKYTFEILHDITDTVLARQKAERNEKILRNLIGTAREAIVGVNKRGRIVLFNKSALKLFQADATTLRKTYFLDFFSEDKYLFRFRRLFTQLISGKRIPLMDSNFRLTLSLSGDEEKIIDTNLSVNNIIGEKLYLFIMRDITKQHRTEMELTEQKMLVRSLIDHLPDHIYYKDTKLRFLLSNKAHCDHLGVASESELIGKTDKDLYPEEFAEGYIRDEKKIVRTKKPLLNIKEKTISKRGEERWILTSKIPVMDGYGRIKGIVGIGRDITELELKDKELRKSRRRLEGLLEISLSEDLDTDTILDLALEKCIGLTDSRMGFICFYDEDSRSFLLHKGSYSAFWLGKDTGKRKIYALEETGICGEAVRQRKPIVKNEYQEELISDDHFPEGHPRIKRYILIPVFSEGKIVAITGVANKVQPYEQTDLLQLELLMDSVWKIIVQKEQRNELIHAKEKAEESDRLKTVFMSTMSHELRTPLNAILGFSSLLEKTNDKEVREYAKYITKGGEQLLSIIENIFYVSAIDGDQLAPEAEETVPERMIRGMLSYFQQHGYLEKIKVETRFPENLSVRIKTDVRKTEQILRVLMDNALKFTPEGKITIGYEIEKEAIKYFVKDTGIGIPPERREEVFEKFRQLDERISREYGGIGIGLYLARRLTEVLKGKIWVEENTPHGSVFYVRIPVKITERSETNKQGQIIGNKPSEKESPIVLIAEDNPVSALLLKKILHNIGVESVLARNGLEAVQYIENRNPCDLILMDLNMPVMDGFEAIEKIKSIRGDLPIIIQTAYDSEYGRTKARELEVEDFINKPVNQEQLRKTVGKFIQVPFVSSGYLSSGT